MEIILIIGLALLLDLILGELPSKIHPVVYMGKSINIISRPLFSYQSPFNGLFLTLAVLLIFLLPAYIILYFSGISWIVQIIIGSLIFSTTFAINELFRTVKDVETSLELDIVQARRSVSYLVSRNTSQLSEEEVISAAIESLTENITDSVVSPFFYALIFGFNIITATLAALAYRVINTLDAMVGYKDSKHFVIGRFPAKLDDLVNFIPARITGLIIVLSALLMGLNWRNSYKIMLRDANLTPSPNSGYPMAAAAGAIECQLIKPDSYKLGDNKKKLTVNSISQVLLLSKITIILFLILALAVYLIIYRFIIVFI